MSRAHSAERYERYGCRCPICTAAHADACRAWRRRRYGPVITVCVGCGRFIHARGMSNHEQACFTHSGRAKVV